MAIISANLSFNRGAHELLDFSSLQVNYSTALAWAQDANSNAAVGQYIYLQESETIEDKVYAKGPYIVEAIGENAEVRYLLGGEGKVDADDVYTKAEIDEALKKFLSTEDFTTYQSEVTAALDTKLEAEDLADYAKSADVVANTDFDTYKDEVTAALDTKLEAEDLADYAKSADVVANTDFETYKEGVTAALADKVAKTEYDAKVTELAAAAQAAQDAAAAAQADYDAFVAAAEVGEAAVDTLKEIQAYIESDGAAAAEMTAQIASKVAQSDFETYKEGVTAALDTKLEAEDLADYAKSADVVSNDTFNTYKAEVNEKLDTVETNAQENVIEKVTLFGNELPVEDKTVAVDFQADDVKLGVAITTTDENSEVVEVFGADKTISQTLQGIYDSLKSGLSGGITSVTAADDSVVVSGDVNNKEVKVQVSAAADNRLSVRTVDGEKGLYVEPLYYMGDDSEVE